MNLITFILVVGYLVDAFNVLDALKVLRNYSKLSGNDFLVNVIDKWITGINLIIAG